MLSKLCNYYVLSKNTLDIFHLKQPKFYVSLVVTKSFFCSRFMPNPRLKNAVFLPSSCQVQFLLYQNFKSSIFLGSEFFYDRLELNNLQYNTLGRYSKYYFSFDNFLQNSLQKSFQFIYFYFLQLYKDKNREF